MKRICVYPSDIVRITGVSKRGAQRLLKKIKILLDKQPHQMVTAQELAEYLGIEVPTLE